MTKLLTEFIQFDGYADLDNIEVKSFIGVRFFSTYPDKAHFNVFKKGKLKRTLCSIWVRTLSGLECVLISNYRKMASFIFFLVRSTINPVIVNILQLHFLT